MNTELDRVMAWLRKPSMRRQTCPTFLFVDLSGYTSLTERRGDAVAADTAQRFRRAKRSLSRRYGAWQVKSMGDGVMIWAPDAGRAVALAADVLQHVGNRADLLPVRVGVHTGPALMRGLDWYGNTVNVAARLADAAEPDQALISDATLSAATDSPARRPRVARHFVLRGLEKPVLAWGLT
jgi:class 3 adenylate cyclase